MNIDNPLVSIIIPCYNSEDYIIRSIESVLEQTYNNLEIIVIDDMSTDSSISKLKMYDSNIKVKIIYSKQKLYTAGARNLGLKFSKGRIVAFLDSDDLWHSDKLKRQVSFMMKNKYAFCFTGVKKIDEFENDIGLLTVPNSINYNGLLRGNKICCSSVTLDKERINNFEFSSKIKIVEDYALWLKILRENHISAYGINEPLTYYRIHKNAKTRNKLYSALDTWKVLRYSEGLSILSSICPFLYYIKDGLRKYFNLK